ncbi:MAG TPA: helix-turn-helix domain-containing protein [Ohtaekwangia sp.]|uniref:winged helix-turn-helix transcriptional regulator n=1 Tax=Ohtaekwangia sp. TaxID=2066019 RepID=UPI002F94F9DB
MYTRKTPITLNCGLDLIREVLYGKWKISILYYISEGVKRPNEIHRKIPDAARRVLNMQLSQLEEHELIRKKIFAEMPPRVEYSLTPLGESIIPVIAEMGKWGDDNKTKLQEVILKGERLPEHLKQ